MSVLLPGAGSDLLISPAAAIADTVSRAAALASGVRVYADTVDLTRWWLSVGVSGASNPAVSMLDDEAAVDAVSAGWGGSIAAHLVDASDMWGTTSCELLIVDIAGGWAIGATVGLTARPTTAPGDGHQGLTAGWTQIGDAVIGTPVTSGSATVGSGQLGWWWDDSAAQVKLQTSGSITVAEHDVAVVGVPFSADNAKPSTSLVSLGSGAVSSIGWADTAAAAVIPGGRGVRRSALAPQRTRQITAAAEGSRFAAALLAPICGRRVAWEFHRRTGAGSDKWTGEAIAQPAWTAARASNRTSWQLTLAVDGNPAKADQAAVAKKRAAKKAAPNGLG